MQWRADNNKHFASCRLQLETTFVDIKWRSRPATFYARAQHLNISVAPPTPFRIVDDQTFDRARYGRGGRRKETVTLHQFPVTPRRSVLGHGYATDDAASSPPAGSDNKVSTVNHSNVSAN